MAYVITELPCSTCRKPRLVGSGDGTIAVGVGPGVEGADGVLPPQPPGRMPARTAEPRTLLADERLDTLAALAMRI